MHQALDPALRHHRAAGSGSEPGNPLEALADRVWNDGTPDLGAVPVDVAAALAEAARDAAPRACSKMSTLASTAIPIVSTRPARPGNVKAARIKTIAARTKSRLIKSAVTAITPESR